MRLLNEEKQEDDAMRSQFKEKWSRLPSSYLTIPFVNDLTKYNNMLKTAKEADASLSFVVSDVTHGIEIFSTSEVSYK
jgi:programmed cell death 6-interacting protein